MEKIATWVCVSAIMLCSICRRLFGRILPIGMRSGRDALVRRTFAHDECSLFVTNDGQQFLGEQG
jgi:hypothetical protein